MEQKQLRQLQLLAGEAHLASAAGEEEMSAVERQVARAQQPRLKDASAPPERAYPCQQLGDQERLGQEIVRTGVQRADAVARGGARRDNKNGN